MNIFIIVPAYNEGPQIKNSIQQILKYYDNIVVINDGSKDNTLEVLKTIPNITVLNHHINRGQGAALQTGMNYALKKGADIIVHFDADGQQSPEEISLLVQKLINSKADIAIGSRFTGHVIDMPFFRKIIVQAGRHFTKLVSGIELSDAHNGFRALTKNAAQTIKITQDRMAHASEIPEEIMRHGLNYIEMPVTIKYTEYSLNKSNLNGDTSWRFINIGFSILWQKLKKRL